MDPNEIAEFESLLADDIRYSALVAEITALTKEPLTEKGRRYLDWCLRERDRLRLRGVALAGEFQL